MRFQYLSSYDKSFKKLTKHKQKRVSSAVINLLNFFATGQKPKGLGLKKLKKYYWEIRVGRNIRILFEFKEDLITFIFVGTHDDIKRWLK